MQTQKQSVGWYWNYFKENFKIMLKELTEYKINFYFAIIVQVVFLISNGMLLYVIGDNFGDIINWRPVDFIVFLLVTDIISMSAAFFVERAISFDLIEGKINQNLVRPLKPTYKYYTSELPGAIFIMVLPNIFILALLLFLGKIDLVINIFTITIGLLFFIFTFLWNGFVYSLGFIKYKLDLTILPVTGTLQGDIFSKFPGPFFKGTSFFKLLFIFPKFLIAIFLVPIIMKNPEPVIEIGSLFTILLVFIGVFALGLVFNWWYGLRNYEGYD